MHVRKASGGTTMTFRRVPYEWPEDGSVIEVPPEFGAELLAIRGGGFSEAPEPKAEVTEPGPVATVTEGEGPQEPGEGDATGPDGDGGDDSEGDDGGEGDAKPEPGKPARKGRAAKAEGTGTPA
jgi:hypothetical protein